MAARVLGESHEPFWNGLGTGPQVPLALPKLAKETSVKTLPIAAVAAAPYIPGGTF